MTPIEALQKYFGHQNFRDVQEKAILSVLDHRDTLVLLPTGGGKSICYQVPAMILDGITIVVSPLVSLMVDQIDSLRRKGIPAAAIYSALSVREIDRIMQNARFGSYKILYITPERLCSENFITLLSKINVCLIAVDEAHCISQWGYDFRPSYLNIKNLRNVFPNAPIIAVTATATKDVVLDIQKQLDFKENNCFQTSFLRKNLVFIVRKVENTLDYLVQSISKFRGSGIVYTRSRQKTYEIACALEQQGISATFYHAGLVHQQKTENQMLWFQGQKQIMVATNAFGMGIDKPDVRFVIHVDVPSSLEEYFQEAGRGGRDGNKAFAVIAYQNSLKNVFEKRLSEEFPDPDFIRLVYFKLTQYFQIPINEGLFETFIFDIKKFCFRYKLSISKVYNSLILLEREGYISYQSDAHRKPVFTFLVNRDELYKIQVKNPDLDGFIKILLRSYTGVFSDYVQVDINLLAQRFLHSISDIYNYFNQLKKKGIIDFIPELNNSLITFTSPRIDIQYLSLSPKNYTQRKEYTKGKMNAVLNYVENTEECRQNIMMEYFAQEKNEGCGVCDICLSKKNNSL